MLLISIKNIVLDNNEVNIFFLLIKKIINKNRIVRTLFSRDVSISMPSGKKIIFEITEIIIPIDIHSIQLNKSEFIFSFLEKITPAALHA